MTQTPENNSTAPETIVSGGPEITLDQRVALKTAAGRLGR
jgi:hypothetical protein